MQLGFLVFWNNFAFALSVFSCFFAGFFVCLALQLLLVFCLGLLLCNRVFWYFGSFAFAQSLKAFGLYASRQPIGTPSGRAFVRRPIGPSAQSAHPRIRRSDSDCGTMAVLRKTISKIKN